MVVRTSFVPPNLIAMKTNLNSIIFSSAIVIATVILGYSYVKRSQVTGKITVTGLGKKDFSSDLIVWGGSFSKQNKDLKLAAAELSKDRKRIEEYLLKSSVNKKEIVISAVQSSETSKPKYSKTGDILNYEFEGYHLSQPIEITSNEVEKIEGVSRGITELLNDGIQFYSEPPRYYYTRLADLKIELISAATKDARARAEKIAQKSGAQIGKLISAEMGIFQITGQNSDEEYSWGGTFNTSSKEKSASITMKLMYKIK